MTRFDDGSESAYRSGLSAFVSEHPYLALFVSAVVGMVVGNLARIFFL